MLVAAVLSLAGAVGFALVFEALLDRAAQRKQRLERWRFPGRQ